MAVWGPIVGSYGRIGISITASNSTETSIKLTVKVWFWSKYAVSDSGNTLYFNSGTDTATTSVGSVNIKTTVSSGSGWSTSNQKCILTRTYTYSRTTASSRKWFAAKLTGIDRVGGTMKVNAYTTVAALEDYTVSFNANGGTGAPSSKTKWYGKTLTLPTTKPTRTGYTFKGWGLSSTTSTVSYNPGGSYTKNASDTLYAVWQANTYPVAFNANGGTGAPSSQTKTYGQTLTLSSTVPTRQNYTFLGWATDPLATEDQVEYSPGSSYTGNSALSLYAVWKIAQIPSTLNAFNVDRCNSAGTLDDEGTYSKMKLAMSLSSDTSYISATVSYRQIGTDAYTTALTATKDSTQIAAWGKTNIVASDIFGTDTFGGSLSTDYSWEIKLDIVEYKNYGTEDQSQMSMERTVIVPAMKFIIDFHSGGDGLAVGKPSTGPGFDVGLDVTIQNANTIGATSAEGVRAEFLKFQANTGRPTISNHVGLANGMWLQGQLASGEFSNILRMNEDGQVELNWTANGLRGRALKMLWQGTWTPGSSTKITVPESDYYSMFFLRFSGRDAGILAIRNLPRTGGRILGTAAYTTGVANSFTRYAVAISISGTTWSNFDSVYAYDDSAAVPSTGNALVSIQGIL